MSGDPAWFVCQNARFGYGGHTVLRDVTLTIARGAAVGLVGPNGAGKTTLLKAMLGLLSPQAGMADLPAVPALRIGYVPQRGEIDELFPFTVDEIVEMGLYGQLARFAGPAAADRAAVAAALAAVRLPESAGRLFRELSGGQKQRVLLARAIVADPQVLILDEPTRGLDLAQAHVLLALLRDLQQRRAVTMVMVSHVLSDVIGCASEVILLHQGHVAYSGALADLDDATLSAIYGMPLQLRPGLVQSATSGCGEVPDGSAIPG